ncbi:MAG: hypothetical protein QXH42_03140 [Thermoplasmata archaeon]
MTGASGAPESPGTPATEPAPPATAGADAEPRPQPGASLGPGGAPPAAPEVSELHGKVLLVLLFMALTAFLLIYPPWPLEPPLEAQNQSAAQLAKLMFGGHGAALVLLSLVLGAAILGGLFLAKEDPEDRGGGKGERASGGKKGGGPQ